MITRLRVARERIAHRAKALDNYEVRPPPKDRWLPTPMCGTHGIIVVYMPSSPVDILVSILLHIYSPCFSDF